MEKYVKRGFFAETRGGSREAEILHSRACELYIGGNDYPIECFQRINLVLFGNKRKFTKENYLKDCM